jgi:hypothetical protein
MIKIDHSNTGNSFEPLKEGEYEVFPIAFDSKMSTSGNEMVVFNYKVREDVEQEGKGKEIKFDNFVATPTAAWRINSASKAADMEHGVEYETLSDWAKAFKGKAIRVVVTIEEYPKQDGSFGKKNVVKAFKASEIGGELTNPADDISDDDLPF